VYRIAVADGQPVIRQVAGFQGYEEKRDLALGEVELQLKYPVPPATSTEK
jgi:hypothetical protein